MTWKQPRQQVQGFPVQPFCMLTALASRCVRPHRVRAIRVRHTRTMVAPEAAKGISPGQMALDPAVKLPDKSRGYLLTLAESNAWWKVQAATEAVALLQQTWRDLNPEKPPPTFEPHAVLDAPGALFVAQKDDDAQLATGDPVTIAHSVLEGVLTDPNKARIGEHLMRLVPVEDCSGSSIADVEALAQRVVPKHFNEDKPVLFAVRAEVHSPRLQDTTVNDLVRRVADTVPQTCKVELSPTPHEGRKTIVLAAVGQNVTMSVVDDWHGFHRYNLQELRKVAQE